MKIEIVKNWCYTFGIDYEYPYALIIKLWNWQIWIESDELYRRFREWEDEEMR